MKSIEQTKIERLKFLLKQTEIFAHFLVGNKTTTEEKTENNKSKVARKRNGNTTKKENMTLLKSLREIEGGDEMEFESPQITRLYFQPSILTGGKLTDYQMDGLNWLISLYETGLNGILADEMVSFLFFYLAFTYKYKFIYLFKYFRSIFYFNNK